MTPRSNATVYGARTKKAAAKRVLEVPTRLLLLDTAVLLWWLQDPARLSRRARSHLAMAGQVPIVVSAVSIWEIGLKDARGLLDLGDSFDGFMTRLESMSGLSILPVDLAIWRKVLALQWDHRDPADRIVVATAMQHHAILLTSDRRIREFYQEAIW